MFRYNLLPNLHMEDGLRRYFEQGIEPGSFLSAVLQNDLKGACEQADLQNQKLLFDHVKWLYNEAPNGSWGSVTNYQNWIKKFIPAEVI